MHATYEEYVAESGLLDQPAPILCITAGCTTEPEDGCDHCAACLEALNSPSTVIQQVFA